MPLDPEDPRLTAYALGELDDEEKRTIEAEMAGSAEAARAVEEVRATARLLALTLGEEPAPGLAPEHHRAIAGEMTAPAAASLPVHLSPQAWAGYGLAASLLLGFGLSAAWLATGGFRAGRPESLALARAPDPPSAMFAERSDLGSPATSWEMQAIPPGTEYRIPAEPAARGFGDIVTNVDESAPAGPPMAADAEPPSSSAPSTTAEGLSYRRQERGMGGAVTGPSSGEALVGGRGGVSAAEPRGLAIAGGSGPAARPEIHDFYAKSHAASPAPSRSAPAGNDPAKRAQVGQYGADFGREFKANAPMQAEAAAKLSKGQAPAAALGLDVVERRKKAVNVEGERLLGRGSTVALPALKPGDPGRDASSRFAEGDAKPEDQVRLLGEKDGAAKLDQLTDLMAAAAPQPAPPAEAPGNEQFAAIVDNAFKSTAVEPQSTFSIDVDTASYSNVRRFLMAENRMPPPDAVRIEEMVNYFPYAYDAPKADDPKAPPFSVNVEIADAPWNRDHRLARIALKGKVETRPRVSNLVFLIDVSGSMDQPNKLPLVQASLRMLVEQLGENDRVSIVVYAGAAGLVLDSAGGYDKPKIAEAIDRLKAGGSTAGGAGIELAYEIARKNFIHEGVNRVILATDGDFNVGLSDDKALEAFIAEKAKSKVDLSVLSFGTGNLKDSKMEGLADKGNGNYAYIDSLLEARKVLVEQMGGTLVTIAKDVKIQVDFNPAKVGAYRLIGYENRVMANEDFANDAKDAGEIGAGHAVTALYELVPPGKGVAAAKAEGSKYTKVVAADPASTEAFTVNLRYKPPGGDVSTLLEHAVTDAGKGFPEASEDYKFATSVAAFGMILRNSPHKGTATLGGVLEIAQSAQGKDAGGYRKEFTELVKKAQVLGEGPK